jgi:uncharacterized protein with GYD domain
MPKYLIKANYNADGAAGLAAKGGTARRDAVGKMMAEVGGTIDCFYYAWGDVDAYLVVDVPSDEAMVGIALSVNKSGATTITTTPLLTPEQIDTAAGAAPGYTPPGQ